MKKKIIIIYYVKVHIYKNTKSVIKDISTLKIVLAHKSLSHFAHGIVERGMPLDPEVKAVLIA